jgi:hypothetical protein
MLMFSVVGQQTIVVITTEHMCRVKRHCIPEGETIRFSNVKIVVVCFRTEDDFLEIHMKSCTGVPITQCPDCLKTTCDGVGTRQTCQRKSCLPTKPRSLKTTIVWIRSRTHTANHGTITNSSNKTINNVTINLHPPERRIVSFLDTDLDAVVQLILKDPSRLVGASEREHPSRALQATHFGEIDHNKSYLGIQKKVQACVWSKTVRRSMCRSEGIYA